MRSYDPNNKWDREELARMNASPWQVAMLSVNPEYTGWGPHEDYMCGERDGRDSKQMFATWKAFGPWALDDLNECVNFYFELRRESVQCPTCEDGNGYHPSAQEIVNTFYEHQCHARGIPSARAWHDKITEDEAKALIDARRFSAHETALSINSKQMARRGLAGHDAINRTILIEARLGRLGIPKICPTCQGHGHVFTEPTAHVALILWWLHPRKGCSRGIEISRIESEDLAAVREFLIVAAQRNASRMSGARRIEVPHAA